MTNGGTIEQRPSVTLLCNLSELELLRFHKLMEKHGRIPDDCPQLVEAIYSSLEQVVGEDVRQRSKGHVLAVCLDRSGKDGRWIYMRRRADA